MSYFFADFDVSWVFTMAGSSLDEGVQKHQKVYSFLKRMLPQDRYEGLRVIEPCVVVADGFKKSFQFAVLGDELLYITENPPRTSKDIKLKVDLACVTSIELVSWKTLAVVLWLSPIACVVCECFERPSRLCFIKFWSEIPSLICPCFKLFAAEKDFQHKKKIPHENKGMTWKTRRSFHYHNGIFYSN